MKGASEPAMKLHSFLPACLLILVALPAVAAPYPRYIQRQVANGTMSIEEANILVENGLGTRPSAPQPTQIVYSGSVYDPLAAAQAESAYNQQVNEARFFGDIQQRDDRFYGRNFPGFGNSYPFYRRIRGCYGVCGIRPIFDPPITPVPITGNAFALPPVRTFSPLIPAR
jgi:hypothetical protein